MENVKGLTNHRGGKTLAAILNVLRNDLGYIVPEPKIINAKNFGVPQNRERIFIVGFRPDLGIKEEDFVYPESTDTTKTIRDIMEKEPVSAKYYLSAAYLECLEKHKARNEAKGSGFGYEIKDLDGVSNTIVTGGMGRERNLIIDKRLKDFTPVTHIKGEVNIEGIRGMTPREWARLQGFSDNFKIDAADVTAYKQFGNSAAISAIQAAAKNLIKKIAADIMPVFMHYYCQKNKMKKRKSFFHFVVLYNLQINEICHYPFQISKNKVLFICNNHNYIYNFNKESVQSVKHDIKNISNYTSIVINDGNILFVGADTNSYPYDLFKRIEALFWNEYEKEEILKTYKNRPAGCSAAEYGNIQKRNARLKYQNLTFTEKQAVFMPYLRKDAKLMKEYNEYFKDYENSMYGILLNTADNKFEKTGRLNIRRKNPKTLLLNDGGVFNTNGEMYDINTDKFEFISELKNLQHNNFVILPEKKILFINSPDNINLYDLNKKKLTNIGKMKSEHSGGGVLLLKDFNVLIFGGKKYYKTPKTSLGQILQGNNTYRLQDNIEIFNLKSKKSQLLPLNYYIKEKPLVLDNGSFIFNSNNNFYIYFPVKYTRE